MSDIFRFEEIPQEIIDELTGAFKSVSFENYGKPIGITEGNYWQIESRKLRYHRFIPEIAEGYALDPITFERKKVVGSQSEGYMVRGIFNGDVADIYVVQSVGTTINSKQSTELKN